MRRTNLLLLLLIGGLHALAVSAADWPMFRGAPSLRGIAEGKVPAKPELLWTFNTEEEIKKIIEENKL